MSDEQAVAAPAEAIISNESSEVEGTESDNDSEGTSEIIQEASAKKVEPKKEEKPASNIRTFNIKVNGKNKEVKLDLSNDKDLERYINLAESSTEKFEEAAMTKKQVEKLITELKTNPLAILKHKDLGLDVKKLAAQILEEEMRENELSPEQKKVRDMEARLKDYEEEKKRVEEEKDLSNRELMKSKAVQQFDEEVSQALTNSSLPKSPYVVKRISDALLEVLTLEDDKGNALYPNATVKDILPFVQEQITNELKAMFEVAPDEVVEQLLGNKLTSMRKNRVAKAKAAPPKIQDTGKSAEPKKEESEERIPFNRLFSPF
jgi:hypothetical protein